jgi:3-oxoacyl-[acyl-carrier protein] reductase
MPPASRDLADTTAVVTGSASGIGRAIAKHLAEAGAAVLIHTRRNRPGAEALAAEIQASGGQSQVVLADLADQKEQDALLEQAWQWRSGVDIWVNNAGADVLTGPPARWSFEEKLERLWRVDVVATVRLARAAGSRMAAQRGGVILNMGWDASQRGMAGPSGELFATAKGAVMAFTRSLAQSLAPKVRVNCLAPGWIRTAWGQSAPRVWQERAEAECLLRRWGTPDDVARVACFLASPTASFLTGQVVEINGGFRYGPR